MSGRIGRWLALGAIVANVGWNAVVERLSFGRGTIAEVTARHTNLFVPAGYAFSIWGIIYLAFLAYGVYQVAPAQRENATLDRLAAPTALAHLLASAWIVTYKLELLASSVAVMVVLLATAFVGYARARAATPAALRIPFALLASWLSVATIANVSVWLVSLGWRGAPLGPVGSTVVMLGLAAALAVYAGLRLGDAVFPVVVAWATVAIAVARWGDQRAVALSALVATALALAAAIGARVRGVASPSCARG